MFSSYQQVKETVRVRVNRNSHQYPLMYQLTIERETGTDNKEKHTHAQMANITETHRVPVRPLHAALVKS